MTLLMICAGICAVGAGAASAATAPSCPPLTSFDPSNFHDPTRVDNTFLPLVPGTQLTLDGRANRGGSALPHRVVFTVTDLTKVINGVRAVVVWDVDRDQGEVVEAELAFFAQDDAGTVWNVGEYPEEYAGGTFTGAPNTWIAGVNGAQAGVHMAGRPTVSRSFYLQGLAPAIGFLDCARVAKTGQTTSVPFASYQGVLVTEEKSPLDPAGGLQVKHHAPGVGIVKIGALNDPEGETLVLVDFAHLDSHALEAARQAALTLDAHGYDVSADYRQTPRAEAPAAPPPPPPPAPEPQPQPSAAVEAVAVRSSLALTARSARARIRHVLRARLPKWTITRLSCRLASGDRAVCQFAAKRRGATLRGSGTITRRPAGGAPGYRLTAKIARTGCHPQASRRCTRRTVWSP